MSVRHVVCDDLGRKPESKADAVALCVRASNVVEYFSDIVFRAS